MNYIAEINAFERWLETNHLSPAAQLLWYKMMMLCNRCGWLEWISVDNLRLMLLIQVNRKATFLQVRDELIASKLIQYQKGKRGTPGKYKMNRLSTELGTELGTGLGTQLGTLVKPINKQKQKQKQNEEDTYASSSSAANAEVSVPVICLTLNTGEDYPVQESQVVKWRELYPAVDVVQELREMKGWTDANPGKRKTKAGILRFIAGWLAREQERKEEAHDRNAKDSGTCPSAHPQPVPEYGEIL